jgi:hypothetical protein
VRITNPNEGSFQDLFSPTTLAGFDSTDDTMMVKDPFQARWRTNPEGALDRKRIKIQKSGTAPSEQRALRNPKEDPLTSSKCSASSGS